MDIASFISSLQIYTTPSLVPRSLTDVFKKIKFQTISKYPKLFFYIKKGVLNNVNRWQPINLQISIVKVYSSLINMLLREIKTEHQLISNNQKVFMPSQGCMSMTVIHATKQGMQKEKIVTSISAYDFRDTFESIANSLIEHTMTSHGFNEDCI